MEDVESSVALRRQTLFPPKSGRNSIMIHCFSELRPLSPLYRYGENSGDSMHAEPHRRYIVPLPKSLGKSFSFRSKCEKEGLPRGGTPDLETSAQMLVGELRTCLVSRGAAKHCRLLVQIKPPQANFSSVQQLLDTFQSMAGPIGLAAERLGIYRRLLYEKLREHKI